MAVTAAKDLVHETSTSTGTGNFTTAAVNGKQRFSDAAAFGTGVTTDVFDYFISNRDVAGEWERGTGHMSAVGTLVRDTIILSSNANAAVSFTAGTKDVTNDVPASHQYRVGNALSELSGSETVARKNLIAASVDAGAILGLMPNPFLEVSQENGTTLMSAISTSVYAADNCFAVEAGATLVFSTQNIVTPFSGTATLKRLRNSVKTIATTSQVSLATGEYCFPALMSIEGYDFRVLGWGTGDARDLQVIGIVMASVTGNYMLRVTNGSTGNSTYMRSIALTANTPTVILETIPGEQAAAWPVDGVSACNISIGSVAGATYQIPSLNTWTSGGPYFSHSSATAWQGTTNAFVQVAYLNAFPVGVLPWTTASQITGEALQRLIGMRRPYADVLRQCQRYLWGVFGVGSIAMGLGYMQGANPFGVTVFNPVEMRAAPTVTFSGNWNMNQNGTPSALSAFGTFNVSTRSFDVTATSAGSYSGGTAARMDSVDTSSIMKVAAQL